MSEQEKHDGQEQGGSPTTPAPEPQSSTSTLLSVIVVIAVIAGALYLYFHHSAPAAGAGHYEYPSGLFSVNYPPTWNVYTLRGNAATSSVGGVNILPPGGHAYYAASSTATSKSSSASSTPGIDPLQTILAGNEGNIRTDKGYISVAGDIAAASEEAGMINARLSSLRAQPGVKITSSNVQPNGSNPSLTTTWDNSALNQKGYMIVRTEQGIQGEVSPVVFTITYVATTNTYDQNVANTLSSSFQSGVADAAVRSILSNMQINAEQLGQQAQSYDGVCDEFATSTTPGASNAIDVLTSISGKGNVRCGDGTDMSGLPSFAIEAKLVNDPSKYYCVDSRGNSITLGESTIASGSRLTAGDLTCGM